MGSNCCQGHLNEDPFSHLKDGEKQESNMMSDRFNYTKDTTLDSRPHHKNSFFNIDVENVSDIIVNWKYPTAIGI